MKNNQTPEGALFGPGKFLEVHSIFLTLQGEGPFAGKKCVFVRLSGCNLQCPGCDTDYTSTRARLTVPAICDEIAKQMGEPGGLVVITGGEPFRQPIELLVNTLLLDHYTVQIETNGTLYRPLMWEHPNLVVVCSPKTGSINSMLRQHISAFKYVAKASTIWDDGLPKKALSHPAKPQLFRPFPDHVERGVEIYLQPMDEGDVVKNEANLQACVQACLKHSYLTLCLQQHKLIGVE